MFSSDLPSGLANLNVKTMVKMDIAAAVAIIAAVKSMGMTARIRNTIASAPASMKKRSMLHSDTLLMSFFETALLHKRGVQQSGEQSPDRAAEYTQGNLHG